ncbi:alkaline phosphatase D family protein [Leptolyngbya sp. 15MV]|nr:alkaline phosphatase D family protein [Leptolyngbya sp. 15MV]
MPISRRRMLGLVAAGGALFQAAWTRAQSVTGYYRLMQGPMIGAVGPDRVSFHLRASAPVPVAIEYGLHPELVDARLSPAVQTSVEGDYTAHLTLTDLSPDTTYYYRPILAGVRDRYLDERPPFRFRTAPMPGSKGRLRIAFGSCARIQAHPVQPIWDAVVQWQPDLFLWLGDNVYHDTLEPRIMDEMYRWQRGVPNLQPLLRGVPNLAIWDDHDYALNDQDRTNPAKDAALASFRKHWANPAGGLPDVTGVFFEFTYGAVDFFMLDGRWHRDPADQADGPGKTMLGAGQLQWRKRRLMASKATFKLIACGSGWSSAKGPSGDAWSAYLHERDALFDFIRDEGITGVVLLSGDTHVGELNAIARSEQRGYDLYELVSSPLAQDTRTNWLERRPEMRIREVYVGDCNFGAIEIDTTLPDPEIRLNLIDTRGNRVWKPVVLKASELANGRSTWRDRIDHDSLRRLEASRAGRDYYSPGGAPD